VDAVEIAAGHRQVTRLLGATGERDRVEFVEQPRGRDLAANVGVRPELDAIDICAIRRSMKCFSILKSGMP
jgi:hypothetical protein